jgi:hypothetical protein
LNEIEIDSTTFSFRGLLQRLPRDFAPAARTTGRAVMQRAQPKQSSNKPELLKGPVVSPALRQQVFGCDQEAGYVGRV